jgi:hypothetical protein
MSSDQNHAPREHRPGKDSVGETAPNRERFLWRRMLAYAGVFTICAIVGVVCGMSVLLVALMIFSAMACIEAGAMIGRRRHPRRDGPTWRRRPWDD